MRLIDADALMEKVRDREKHIPLYAPFKLCTADVVDLKFLLNSEPEIDAVPVVRCKDCKHYVDRKEISKKCCYVHLLTPHPMPEDGFCSYGEKRGEGNEQNP